MISLHASRLARTVSAAAMLCAIASCKTYPTQLTTNTVGLPLCDAHNTPLTRFWVTIRLQDRIDDIFDPGARSERNVRYTVLSKPAVSPQSREIDAGGERQTSSYPDVGSNPYDSDLGALHGIQHNDIAGFRVFLDDHTPVSGENLTNYMYYQEQNALGNGDDIRGMAVIPRSRYKFICSGLSLGETDPADGRTKDVVYFYIRYRHDPSTPTFDSFSIFLVPRAGATTTVVIIDPKIMNNG